MSAPRFNPNLIWTDSSGRLTGEAQRFMRQINDAVALISGPFLVPRCTVASVPAAADSVGGLIFVSNEAGGATVAFSDGTNWRRVQDRAVIS